MCIDWKIIVFAVLGLAVLAYIYNIAGTKDIVDKEWSKITTTTTTASTTPSATPSTAAGATDPPKATLSNVARGSGHNAIFHHEEGPHLQGAQNAYWKFHHAQKEGSYEGSAGEYHKEIRHREQKLLHGGHGSHEAGQY